MSDRKDADDDKTVPKGRASDAPEKSDKKPDDAPVDHASAETVIMKKDRRSASSLEQQASEVRNESRGKKPEEPPEDKKVDHASAETVLMDKNQRSMRNLEQQASDVRDSSRGGSDKPDGKSSDGVDHANAETVILRKGERSIENLEQQASEIQDSGGASSNETIIRGGGDDSAPATSENATILRGSSKPAGATSENATILREPGQSDNATVLRGPASNEHATILRGGSGDSDDDAATKVRDRDRAAPDDSTVLKDGGAGGSDDSTIINSPTDNDATVIGGQGGEADTTYVATADRPSQHRGNSEAGRLLKNRFVLEEKVGSGGMGDVYKALDLRQQEAQERNPYIAIKILNESFARHKDAFISLQREATRTRGIPHPNIMAVYDFDREGDTVFMSMELLDGKPLDDYLKDHPEGVSTEDAWNIIDGICMGLSRAHGAGIVHSDFKPGNIYYTDDKLAKVFDFGIARAVTNPGDIKADGEKTVFDAGSLGALTPTYASLEMLTGKEPTKSDDVYAVALVAYELFTGRHPYNRTPADKALERGLEPDPVPILKRRHWRALKKGLALKSEDRWQSIDEFSEGMFSEDPPYFRYATIVTLVLATLGTGLYSYFNVEEVPQELTELQGRLSADRNNLSTRLGDINSPLNKDLNFESPDWREELRVSLSRLRGVTLSLQDNWPEHWERMPDDQKPQVEKWKNRVLEAYLQEIGQIRDDVASRNLTGSDLDANRGIAQDLLEDLAEAQKYLDEAKQNFNFDAALIADEQSRLSQAIQFREFQLGSIVEDIEEREARAAADQLAEEQRLAREAFETARNEAYLAKITRFEEIMRCKGEIPQDELAELDPLINGAGGERGLKQIFPEQFAVDRPGIVTALKGCIEQRIAVRAPDEARQVKARVLDIFPGEAQLAGIVIEDLDPCAARNLEGRGASNGRWCSDRLAAGGTGPELVVIPNVEGDIGKFAISRIEIKVSDYNAYCEATGCQTIDGPGTIPVTNISLNQAREYTRWLSDQTGERYRLPTPREWTLAARTDRDEEVDDNINCTVDSRGVRLGEKLLSTLSGRPNRWGLYNFVGNAREWAVDGESVLAMGGAHTDPKPECTLDKKVAHNGNPDAVTGFRIVRSVER